MFLTGVQKEVAGGMSIGLISAVAAVFAAPRLIASTKPELSWAVCLLLPTLALAICIARLARHRFFTPEDIDGNGLARGTDRARLLQAILQNTLEQAALATPVYVAAIMLSPDYWRYSATVCACIFMIGRLLFFAGYSRGAPGRALGFTLTFYPTILLMLCLLVSVISGLV